MLDRDALIAACTAHGQVARVVVAKVQGSAPREVGAAMLVWEGGQSGTIGGGALEYELARTARNGATGFSKHALGPDMGQCCGGAVQVLTEQYDLQRAKDLPLDVFARGKSQMPLPVARVLSAARQAGVIPQSQRIDDWMIEPIARRTTDVWIWGAGHVGRALVSVMAPLPDVKITWVDTSADRFPCNVPVNVTALPAAIPADVAPYAPVQTHHLIVTYSHAIDLALCDALLARGFASCGLIGSATKWARFRKRLSGFGHAEAQISRITCPIGDPSLGKHPQMIAIGVVGRLLGGTRTTHHALEANA